MASTTKTTNLELSQFVGTDKPAWLTDYNGDMQKIDDGYKKLEDANTATQADLDATKQNLSGSQTDINDVKANVQALEAQDIALGNRLTVVEGNYDTMHHEVAINKQSIEDIETDLGIDTALTTTATTVHGAINELDLHRAIDVTPFETDIVKVTFCRMERAGNSGLIMFSYTLKTTVNTGWINVMDIRGRNFIDDNEHIYHSTTFAFNTNPGDRNQQCDITYPNLRIYVNSASDTVHELRLLLPFIITKN